MKRLNFWKVMAVVAAILFAAQVAATWFFMSKIIPPLGKIAATFAERLG